MKGRLRVSVLPLILGKRPFSWTIRATKATFLPVSVQYALLAGALPARRGAPTLPGALPRATPLYEGELGF